MLAKLNGEMPSFGAKSPFWREVRAAADKHLADAASRGQPPVGDPRLRRKAVVILIWLAASYLALLSAPALWIVLLAAVSLALASAALGFGVFHDANHRTLFRTPAANLLAARTCSVLLGPSRHFWVHKHQSLHHRQPNVFGWDDDLETRGLLRLSPKCPWSGRFHRQEFKALLYYGLNTVEWLFWKDFHCLVRGRLNDQHALVLRGRERAELLICKALYLLLFVLPPFVVLPFWQAVLAFVVFHLVLSWALAIVFQIAHLTPEMEFEGVREGDDWATHQMRTTADFATQSRLTTWFTGGLNHQVEHHLFPNVAHSHYSALRPVVRAVAERHGIRCHDLGSVSSAIAQHFLFLKALGNRSERSLLQLPKRIVVAESRSASRLSARTPRRRLPLS
jgi:linoleoyl-CoA desaturase